MNIALIPSSCVYLLNEHVIEVDSYRTDSEMVIMVILNAYFTPMWS